MKKAKKVHGTVWVEDLEGSYTLDREGLEEAMWDYVALGGVGARNLTRYMESPEFLTTLNEWEHCDTEGYDEMFSNPVEAAMYAFTMWDQHRSHMQRA